MILVVRLIEPHRRQGRRHTANTAAALAIRSHAEYVDAPEEQGGERRAEIVKNRADHEENVRRNTVGRPAGGVPTRRFCGFCHEPRVSGITDQMKRVLQASSRISLKFHGERKL
ncbi:hypothetical protein BH20ACT23_BH20ACT23_09560 [soil metagenome]